MKDIHKFCKSISNDPDLSGDAYLIGFIVGYLAARGKQFRDLCRVCEGCERPICFPGGGS